LYAFTYFLSLTSVHNALRILNDHNPDFTFFIIIFITWLNTSLNHYSALWAFHFNLRILQISPKWIQQLQSILWVSIFDSKYELSFINTWVHCQITALLNWPNVNFLLNKLWRIRLPSSFLITPCKSIIKSNYLCCVYWYLRKRRTWLIKLSSPDIIF
jgi:hypothetical protein